MPKTRLKILLLLLWMGSAWGLAPEYHVSQYRVAHWTALDGLPGASVSALFQDQTGYLWVGTYRGAARFDGHRFLPLSELAQGEAVPDEVVQSIIQTGDGSLWFAGERHGLLILSPDLTVAHLDLPQKSGGTLVNYLYLDSDDRVWVATGTSLFRIDDPMGSRTAEWELDQTVWFLAEGADGVLWAATEQGLWHRNAEGEWQRIAEPQLERAHVWSVAAFGDQVWAAWRGGLSVGRMGDWTHYSPEDGLPHPVIRDIDRDRDGNIWISTAGAGVTRFEDGLFETIDRNDGLASDVIWELIEDRDGNLWTGGSGGLTRISNASVQVFGKGEGIESGLVWSALADGEDLWLGTNGDGLIRIDGAQNVQPVGWSVGRPGAGIIMTVQAETPRTMLVGSLSGVDRYHLDSGEFEHIPNVPLGRTRAIYPDGEGGFWVSMDSKTGRLQGDRFVDLTKALGLERVTIASFLKTQGGDLLAAAETGGVWLIAGDGAQRLDDGGLSMAIRNLWQAPDGTIWVAGFGLYWLNGRELTPVASLNKEVHAQYHAMMPDDQGGLWISTNVGVIRVEQRDLQLAARRRDHEPPYRLFGAADGMRSAEANGGNQSPLELDAKGRLWVPTTDGVVAIDTQQVAAPAPPPKPLIERLVAEGVNYRANPGIELPPGTDRVRIDFTALRLNDPQRIQFRYRLEPSEPEWTPLGRQRSLNLSRLSPGDYLFAVQAAGHNGVWGAPATLQVEIKPHWWQRVSVQAVGVMLAMLALLSIPWLRIRGLRNRERELQTVVAARTKELEEANHALARAAMTDGLTGLPNQRYFLRKLERVWKEDTEFCLASMDIDHFKRLNDYLGHLAGDECLQQIGQIFKRELSGPRAFCARVGGEEFAAILLGDLSEARVRLRKTIQAIEQACIRHPDSVRPWLTLSVGVAQRARTDLNMAALRQRADDALYAAKEGGRNALRIAS